MFFRCLILVLTFSQTLTAEPWKKPGCQRMAHTRKIDIPDCIPFEITTMGCRGFCESLSLPSIMLGFKRHPVTSLGQCCNIMDSEDVEAEARCLDGIKKLVFKSALSCECYHCQKE